MFMLDIKKIKNILFELRFKLLTIFVIYFFTLTIISSVNYPYIDDINRQRSGATGFAESYSRWGSEILSWIFNGSRHLTDMGLTSSILTTVILTITSLIVVAVLTSIQFNWYAVVLSTLIGLNPWFLQCVSFRFDSPYMALSVLFSVLPFLFWNKKRYFYIISYICLFLMCNTYQPSSGLYIVLFLAMILKYLLQGTPLLLILRKSISSGIIYIMAVLTFKLESLFNPLLNVGPATELPQLRDIPDTVLKNTFEYLSTIRDQSAHIWILLTIILTFLFIIILACESHISKFLSLLYIVIYLILGAILSYGVLLVFLNDISSWNPRYSFGFAFFFIINLILMTSYFKNFLFVHLSKLMICVALYFFLSFPFTYASCLHYQKDAFERQSIQLAADLKNFVTVEKSKIYVNSFFKDSVICENTSQNYPILTKLVPSNSTPYWPNFILFDTYSNLHTTIESFNPDEINLPQDQLIVSNYYWDIYELNNKFYVLMK